MGQGVDITVVIPVYNKARFLPALLDSLSAQVSPDTTFDVVAVDDGSTDGSGEILDQYDKKHSWLRVMHQANSGWPGQPRNRGLAESDSRYVFFADADDFLGVQSLARMVAAADKFECDILLPRVAKAHDPYRRTAFFERSRADVPIPMRFKTLTPHKLFRRSFLEKHALRFVEEKLPLEDGIFLSRAYLLARRVSSAADYVYYYRVHGEETSISSKRRDPWAQRRSVGMMLTNVRELCTDPEIADEVCLDIYRRKGIRYVGPERLPNYGAPRRLEQVLAAADLADAFMPPELEQRLPLRPRLRSKLVRQRDPAASYALAVAELTGPPPVRVVGSRVVLDTGAGRATVDVTRDVVLDAGSVGVRATPAGARVRIPLRSQGVRFSALDRDQVTATAHAADGSATVLQTHSVTQFQASDLIFVEADVPHELAGTGRIGRRFHFTVEIGRADGRPVLCSTASSRVRIPPLRRWPVRATPPPARVGDSTAARHSAPVTLVRKALARSPEPVRAAARRSHHFLSGARSRLSGGPPPS